MKSEIDDATAVSTHGACTTCLLDEDSLQLLLPTRDGLADAPLAAPLVPAPWAPAVLGELRKTVTFTAALPDRSSSTWIWRPTPIPHERNGSLNLLIQPSPDSHSEHMFASAPDGRAQTMPPPGLEPGLQD